jgi:hypothetical protein
MWAWRYRAWLKRRVGSGRKSRQNGLVRGGVRRRVRKRKGVFMKNDIPRHKKFLGFKIKDAIAFLTKRVPKKKTTTSPGVKFMSGVKVSGIAKAPKDP